MANIDVASAPGTTPATTLQPLPSEQAISPFPPPKIGDKPRPHVCTICTRSFARLEHLKRHERSHTKEKPFECPQCARCFARRDLLLRHQQKLHQQGPASSRPRNARRESTTGLPPAGAARVRKNSVAGPLHGNLASAAASMRPRANTISHIDPAALDSLLVQHGLSMGADVGEALHSPLAMAGVNGFGAFDYRGLPVSTGAHGDLSGLPKIETHVGMGIGGGLRTAPLPLGPDDMELENFFGPVASTVNPNELHHFQAASLHPGSSFHAFATPTFGPNTFDEDEFAWSAGWKNGLVFPDHDGIMDEPSPSAISSTSHGMGDMMIDGTGQGVSVPVWHDQFMPRTSVDAAAFSMDSMAPIFPDLTTHAMSPSGMTTDFPTSSSLLHNMSPTTGGAAMPNHYFHFPGEFGADVLPGSDTGSISSSSLNGSARHSSITSVSTDTITEATRQSLVFNLSQAMGYGLHQRNFSQPAVSSPLSLNSAGKTHGQLAPLPSTMDLQRYVNAYIHYFHPHLPFLHLPTLSFDTPTYTHHLRAPSGNTHDNMMGGGGCLILAMAAIGALYEFDHAVAKDLFEAAKKMILYYLDERRKAGLSAAVAGSKLAADPLSKPPLWLVQAMALNLIFGHNCGDRQAAQVASTHCAALVSLAKAAGLDGPSAEGIASQISPENSTSTEADKQDDASDASQKKVQNDSAGEYNQWIEWKQREERKRTFFAVFSMSSLLVSACAHAPRILNSEIHLDLPCEEDLWSAESPKAWAALGGSVVAQSRGLPFHAAMTYLLEASNRQPPEQGHDASQRSFLDGDLPMPDMAMTEIRPSTFGCYILINALHVYIWETRQRHTSRLWHPHETEAMHAQVKPALQAWQLAWKAHPHHSIERPSPYGPLPADCIPLLDLAYVRLYVNLNRSKELLWQRDFESMCHELARGMDISGQTEGSPDRMLDPSNSLLNGMAGAPNESATQDLDANGDLNADIFPLPPNHTTKREKHLRKAAFYAADSLAMADKLGTTYADLTARVLPGSSAMCTFDCAQILAEWIAMVQERVGRFVGILGRDDVDFSTVPAIMLVEEEDVKLLHKIASILRNIDAKLARDAESTILGGGLSKIPIMGHCGYGARLLMVTAYMLDKSAVWSVTHVLARALEVHASQIHQRAEASISAA